MERPNPAAREAEQKQTLEERISALSRDEIAELAQAAHAAAKTFPEKLDTVRNAFKSYGIALEEGVNLLDTNEVSEKALTSTQDVRKLRRKNRKAFREAKQVLSKLEQNDISETTLSILTSLLER